MDVEFEDAFLARLERDPALRARLPDTVVKKFRMRMQSIRAARDPQDLRALKSLHLEKLQGRFAGLYSMRLNDQYRLLLKLEGQCAVVVEISRHYE